MFCKISSHILVGFEMGLVEPVVRIHLAKCSLTSGFDNDL